MQNSEIPGTIIANIASELTGEPKFIYTVAGVATTIPITTNPQKIRVDGLPLEGLDVAVKITRTGQEDTLDTFRVPDVLTKVYNTDMIAIIIEENPLPADIDKIRRQAKKLYNKLAERRIAEFQKMIDVARESKIV
jgi:hypothetical protein